MNTTLSARRRDAEALVVEHDPSMRERLVSALTKRGYGVRACNTLTEGKAHFAQQSVVVTHANGDTAELRKFVRFVRQAAGSSQPYIVAVGEADSPSGLSQDQLGLDAFVAVPLEEQRLVEHIETMAQRLLPEGPEAQAEPAASRPAASAAVLGHFAPVLLDHLPQALAMFDTGMRYLAANRRFTAAFGLDDREILGRSHYEVFPDLHTNWRRLFERALEGEVGRIDEDFFQRSDGSSDWVRWEVRPWHEADGQIGGLVLSQEVITARKREERRRVFDRNLAVSLFESQSLPMLLVALDGRILRSSPAARAVLGLQPTADGRLPFWEVYPDREQEEVEKARFACLATPPADGTLGEYAPGDIVVPGTPVQRLHWSASAHRNAEGETQAVLLIGSLVPVARPVAPPPPVPVAGEEPAAWAAPVAAPTEDLARHVPFGLVQLDREGTVTAANGAVTALLGRPAPVGSAFEPWLSAGAPEEVLREPVLREWRDNVWRRHMARTFSLASADGLLKEIEVRPRLLPDGHLLLILSDVTESRRAEDALRTSEAKYRGLFRELPLGIALADCTGSLVEGNPALEKLSGYSRVDLRRLRLGDLVRFETDRETSEVETRPGVLLARDGARHPVTVSLGAIRNPAGDAVLQACFVLPREGAAAAEPATTETASPAEATDAGESSELGPWRDLAFENLRTAMIVTDLRGRIRVANQAAARFIGTDPQMLEGTALYRLFRPEDPSGFSREVSTRLNAAKRWECETVFHDIEGRPAGTCRAEITPASGTATPGLLCLLQPVFAQLGTSA